MLHVLPTEGKTLHKKKITTCFIAPVSNQIHNISEDAYTVIHLKWLTLPIQDCIIK